MQFYESFIFKKITNFWIFIFILSDETIHDAFYIESKISEKAIKLTNLYISC